MPCHVNRHYCPKMYMYVTFYVAMVAEQSLPVAFGAETAKWICVGAIDITQISVAGTVLLITANYIPLKTNICLL